MSLLMKALEKAARDHDQSDPSPPASTASEPVAPSRSSLNPGLTLEPLAPGAATPGTAASSARRSSTPARDGAGTGPAQAAALLRAGQVQTESGAVTYIREHPLVLLGSIAALFLFGYGGYVFLQLNNPGMFAQSPPRPPQSGPIASAPPASAPAPGSSPIASGETSLLPPLLPATGEKSRPATPIATSPPSAPVAPPVTTPTISPPPPAAATPTPAPPVAPRDTIKVVGGSTSPAISPMLAEGYQALNTGNLEMAQRLYNLQLRSDPNNVDALLGLAAIATQQNDAGQAANHYLRILELDPRNALAQAGLIAMLGRADPLAAETRLKQLIAREPSAYLYFTLGNLYADVARWPDAQQAYFQAFHLQPGNPDYAYNLAVGLERVGQSRLALNYYRTALQLAAGARTNFSVVTVQERISRLEKVALP